MHIYSKNVPLESTGLMPKYMWTGLQPNPVKDGGLSIPGIKLYYLASQLQFLGSQMSDKEKTTERKRNKILKNNVFMFYEFREIIRSQTKPLLTVVQVLPTSCFFDHCALSLSPIRDGKCHGKLKTASSSHVYEGWALRTGFSILGCDPAAICSCPGNDRDE